MKKTVFGLVATLVLLLNSGVNAVASDQRFTVEDEKSVLQWMDDLCGDVWCEGDFSFDFRDFSCIDYGDTIRCDLKLTLRYPTTLKEDYDTPAMLEQVVLFDEMSGRCSFKNIKSVADLVEDETFYEELNSCIDHLEGAFYKKLGV